MPFATKTTPARSFRRCQRAPFGKAAELERAIDFGIGERLVAAVAPAEAPENANIRRDFLLEVQAEAVFVAALAARRDDVRRGRFAVEIIVDGLAVVAHIGVVEIAEQADSAVAMGNELPRASNSRFSARARAMSASRLIPLATLGMSASAKRAVHQ